jgi:hypothetical protein
MIRSVYILAGAILATGCATYAQLPSDAVYGATLSETPDNATRDMIRTYVRDVIGPEYIVDVDALTRSNKLRAVDRGRGQVSGRPIPVPDVMFWLELAETYDGPICRLVPQGDIADAPVLVLPPEVACQLMPTVI